MSQAITQSQSQTSSIPTSGAVTENNTAKNAGINDPQSKAPAPATAKNQGPRDPNDELTPEQAKEEGLPEQKHAGAVGYGPDFANKNRATMGDKITGIKEQLVGKVTKNPELVQKGHERKTGELKQREREQKETDPFATEDKKELASPSTSDAPNPDANTTDSTKNPQATTGLGGGKSTNVDLKPDQGRLTADPSHPAAQDEGVKRAAEI